MIAGHAHDVFIIWAYLGTALLTLGLTGYVIWEARQVAGKLQALDKAGIRRRSAGTKT